MAYYQYVPVYKVSSVYLGVLFQMLLIKAVSVVLSLRTQTTPYLPTILVWLPLPAWYGTRSTKHGLQTGVR